MAADFQHLNDLASSKNGGEIIFATDDFFAVAENLIKGEDPIWLEGEYTACGKWMDGWETRRRRKAGHDFCVVALAASSSVLGVDIDTAYFTGNHAPSVSIQAAATLSNAVNSYVRTSEMGCEASEGDVERFRQYTSSWTTILGPVKLKPGYHDSRHNLFPIDTNGPWKYIRLNLYPDGGIARLRVYGRVIPPTKLKDTIDLAAVANGGECIQFSNAHFGHPRNLVSPLRAQSMADGWETARRLDRTPILEELPSGLLNHNGNEWCILKLGVPGRIKTIIIDTHHFKGNYPDRILVEATRDRITTPWTTIVPFSKVGPNTEHKFEVSSSEVFHFVKLTIQPDGGVSRLRVMGQPAVQ